MISNKWKMCFALALGLIGAGVWANAEMRKEPLMQEGAAHTAHSPFFQRAYTSRVGMTGRRVPSAYLADICLSGDSSRVAIHDLIAQRIDQEDPAVAPVKDAVYRKLLVARPCA